MKSRIVALCYHFSGFTPMNVYDLPVDDWRQFRAAVDDLTKKK